MHRPGRAFAIAATAVIAAASAPAVARGAEAVIAFDDLANGVEVTTQYLNAGGQGQGLEFGKFNNVENGVKPRVETVPAGQAQSGTKVASILSATGETTETRVFGTFPFQKRFVRVFVGLAGAGSTPVTLRAFDNDGDPLPNSAASQTKTVTGGAGYKTMLEVTSVAGGFGQIKFFSVRPPNDFGSGTPQLKIDDVTFDTPDPGDPPQPPDFGLDWKPLVPNTPLGLSKGESVSTQITINRSNGSNGNINFSVDPATLPSGVAASFSPDSAPGTATSTKLTLTAGANAATVDEADIKVIAKPVPSAGTANRSLDIPITIRLSDFNLFVSGIEVTQGIQRQEDVEHYYKEVDIGGGFSTFAQDQGSCSDDFASLPPRNMTDLNAPIVYGSEQPSGFASDITLRQGQVRLAADKKTNVRVYANVLSPEGGSAQQVPAVLHGFRNGKPLPGSPLQAPGGPRDLAFTGRAFVNCRDRADPAGAYVFTLPGTWVSRGAIELRAQLLPAKKMILFGPGGECGTASCAADNTLRLSSVDFTPTAYVTITPVEMIHAGDLDPPEIVRPPPPKVAFADARMLTPSRTFLNDGNKDGYAGTINILFEILEMRQRLAKVDQGVFVIGDGLETPLETEEEKQDARKEIKRDACSAVLDRLEDWADDHPHGDATVGVYKDGCPGVTEGSSQLLPDAEGFAVADSDRPRTSVAHELFHIYGRKHASKACGGGTGDQEGDTWPPDQEGHMHGIGFHPDSLSPLVPFGILKKDDPFAAGQFAEYHDFMSYCKESNAATWISDRGWNETLQVLYRFQKSRGRTSKLSVHGAQAGDTLRVSAALTNRGLTISSVKPATGDPLGAVPDSPFRLIARDALGNVLAEIGMRATETHVDDSGPATYLRADVPAAGVASVDVVRGAQVLGTRARSANPPVVKLSSPRGGALVGRSKAVDVRWSASDADGDTLYAKVDYSSNDGRTWKPVFMGRSTGEARLRSSLFTTSSKARVRVRINDGFNEISARSAAFRARGSGPTVTILSPRGTRRSMSDALLYLAAEAYDENGAVLDGRQVQWFAGSKRIARGLSAAARVPAGTRRIRAVVGDRRGRRASASVSIRVAAAAPQFLRLEAPSRVSSTARRVTLGIAATAPATLRARGRRFDVGRKLVKVRIRVSPGTGRLTIPLRLSAAGKATLVNLVIPRE